jgi:hypothetical protein
MRTALPLPFRRTINPGGTQIRTAMLSGKFSSSLTEAIMRIPTNMGILPAVSIVALAMVLPFAPRARAQSEPGARTSAAPRAQAPSAEAKSRPVFDPRDLSGQWSGGLGGGLHSVGPAPPLTAEGQARFDANTAELKIPGATITVDPTFSCEPPGVPRIYDLGSSLMEVYQSRDRPERIFLFYEVIHTWRTIWMNNRPMPDNGGVPRALGYSLGHWEGNDLVVDTDSFADWGWLNRGGYPHSDALHVVERFHRVDHEHLRLDVTLNDSKAYAQPWKMAIDFTLKPDWDFAESFCRPSESANFKRSGGLTATDPTSAPAK